MPHYADLVKENTSTTGTGALTLTGAVTNYFAFSSLGSGSRIVEYRIDNGANQEVGRGTFDGTTGLTRDEVITSSNAGALINITGAATVLLVASERQVSRSNAGYQYAMARGYSTFLGE
jgi:hypothetical protein